MTGSEFEAKLKELDPRFSVIENENRLGLSNIFFAGLNYDLPVISTHDLREDVDQDYRYAFPNGMRSRFWTQGEVMARCEDFLTAYNKGKFKDLYD